MPVITIRLPDIGEGIAQAELTSWCVAIGDLVAEDAPLAEVMTDKATVEIPSAVSGRVVWLGGEVGETLAIGCDLVRIDVADVVQAIVPQQKLEDALAVPGAISAAAGNSEIRMPISGLRRVIADRMEIASRIPQYTIVEEVDVTALQAAREQLNAGHPGADRLTVLPFIIRALVGALAEHPQINAHVVEDGKTLVTYAAIHCGIATETPGGLMVPVLRDAQLLDLRQIAAGSLHLAATCRAGTAARSELAGSTITVSSLGSLGGIATTPILNAPEVAVIGVNRIVTRPMWDGRQFAPRQVMNMSCSFDHRVIDGWAAATFIASLKRRLEAAGAH
jgi:2-oxoisovalerate dehydrogenase E2 component (dihydrolipoyl transacylase)